MLQVRGHCFDLKFTIIKVKLGKGDLRECGVVGFVFRGEQVLRSASLIGDFF